VDALAGPASESSATAGAAARVLMMAIARFDISQIYVFVAAQDIRDPTGKLLRQETLSLTKEQAGGYRAHPDVTIAVRVLRQ
jgi:hypothetical protein